MGIITDIIKGLPISAVQKEKIIDLENKLTALEAENKRLKRENRDPNKQLGRVIGPDQIEKDEERVLLEFGKYNASATLHDITQNCEMSETRAQFYIDNLKEIGLLEYKTVTAGKAFRYIITHSGRKYLITKSLVD